MSELFEALKNFKPSVRPNSFAVEIDGAKTEVDFEMHKEILKHGADAFIMKGGKVVRKPPPEIKVEYKNFVRTTYGNKLWYNDPYFPKDLPSYNKIHTSEIWGVDWKELVRYVYEIRKDKTKRRKKSNYSGWQTNLMTDTVSHCAEYNKLVKGLNDKIDQICKEEGYSKLKLAGIWTNISPKGGYNVEHVHPEAILSGVIYIQANADHGCIVFGDHKIVPKTGTVHIFGALEPHRVEENDTDVDRISIAFNYVFADKEGYSWH